MHYMQLFLLFFNSPQLMDIFGSTGSVGAHEAATEVFANPSQTTR